MEALSALLGRAPGDHLSVHVLEDPSDLRWSGKALRCAQWAPLGTPSLLFYIPVGPNFTWMIALAICHYATGPSLTDENISVSGSSPPPALYLPESAIDSHSFNVPICHQCPSGYILLCICKGNMKPETFCSYVSLETWDFNRWFTLSVKFRFKINL